MGKIKKNKKRNNTVKNVNTPFLSEVKVVQPTQQYETFVKQLITKLGLNDTDYVIRDSDIMTTVCYRVMVNQTIYSKSFKLMTDYFFLKITPINDGVYIYLMKVNPLKRRMGVGSNVLKVLRTLSDILNTPLYLIPVPLRGENVDYSDLTNFYKKNSFNREKTSRYWKYVPSTVEDTISYKMVG